MYEEGEFHQRMSALMERDRIQAARDREQKEREGAGGGWSNNDSGALGGLILFGIGFYILYKVATFVKANSAVIGTCVAICVICFILCFIFSKKLKSGIPVLITILVSIGLFIGAVKLGQNDLKRFYSNVGEKIVLAGEKINSLENRINKRNNTNITNDDIEE